MEKLDAYDACVATKKQYAELFRIEDNSDIGKVAAEKHAACCVSMKGVFWSAKYQKLIYGVFEKATVLPFKEFKRKLIQTVPPKA